MKAFVPPPTPPPESISADADALAMWLFAPNDRIRAWAEARHGFRVADYGYKEERSGFELTCALCLRPIFVEVEFKYRAPWFLINNYDLLVATHLKLSHEGFLLRAWRAQEGP